MTAFFRTFFILCVLCCGPALAADKVFKEPLWFDDRLDVCLTWATNCGKPAADNFCMRRRYTSAASFVPQPGVGKTRVSGTNQICNGKGCTGFASITCTGLIPSERVFANPAYNNYRLDSCKFFGKECGKPAADAFCAKNGYRSSFYSVLDSTAGRGKTKVIGNEQICDGKGCVGFQMIVCQ